LIPLAKPNPKPYRGTHVMVSSTQLPQPNAKNGREILPWYHCLYMPLKVASKVCHYGDSSSKFGRISRRLCIPLAPRAAIVTRIIPPQCPEQYRSGNVACQNEGTTIEIFLGSHPVVAFAPHRGSRSGARRTRNRKPVPATSSASAARSLISDFTILACLQQKPAKLSEACAQVLKSHKQ